MLLHESLRVIVVYNWFYRFFNILYTGDIGLQNIVSNKDSNI